MIELRGLAWDHTRGFLPLVATAQRMGERHPELQITWEKRSLRSFGDDSLDDLAQKYDFLVIDHPTVGEAAARGLLLPLEDYLSAEFLEEQKRNSVGASYRSYTWEGHQWALATDAAAPVSAWRADLLAHWELSAPVTWEDALALARKGLVVIPSKPVDSLMHYFMLCAALEAPPFDPEGNFDPGEDAGIEALRLLREIVRLCPAECLGWNPIQTFEAMVAADANHPRPAAFCPFAFGYSNYARPEYTQHPLAFAGLVTLQGEAPLHSVLGGAGLALSAWCREPEAAARYAGYVASAECQVGLYTLSGGQPGHRAAWTDTMVNSRCGGYFSATLPTVDTAFLRPRHDGYLAFQNAGGPIVHRFLTSDGDPSEARKTLERLRGAGKRESAC